MVVIWKNDPQFHQARVKRPHPGAIDVRGLGGFSRTLQVTGKRSARPRGGPWKQELSLS